MSFVILRSYVLTISIFLIPVAVFAQQKKGEIININYKYKIAFTDLTEGDVRAGDKVSIVLPEGRQVYLEVVESYPVMAKLTFSTDPGSRISEDDFAKISVGAVVQPVALIKAAARDKPVDVSVKPAVPSVVTPQEWKTRQNSIEFFEPKASVTTQEVVMPVKEVVKMEALPSIVQKPVTKKNVQAANLPGERVLPKSAVKVEVPVVAVRMDTVRELPKVELDQRPLASGSDERVEKLTANMINLSEHITRLLTDRANLEVVLKEKEALYFEMKKKSEDLISSNKILDNQVRELQGEVNRLKVKDVDSQKKTADLEMKLAELKKKLARMVDIINKHMKSYE